jgi:hypothetical protein
MGAYTARLRGSTRTSGSRYTMRSHVITFLLLGSVAGCGKDPVATATCDAVPPGRSLAVLRMAVQSITQGTPPTPVDLDDVRGTLTLRVNIDTTLVPAGGGRLELRAAGKLLSTSPVARSGSGNPLSVDLPFASTSVANGTQTLDIELLAGTRSAAACPAALLGTLAVTITVDNP